MTLIKSHRPSPWMLVAVAALAFAMVGTAIAGTDAVSKLTKSKVRSIADKEIDKKAGGLSVAKAKEADHAKTADSATTASNANALGGKSLAQVQPLIFGASDAGVINPLPTTSTNVVSTANIELPTTSTVTLQGSVELQGDDTDERAGCLAARDNSTFGPSFETTFDDIGTDNEVTMSVVGTQTNVPAGVHSWQIRCSTLSAAGSVLKDDAAITVQAIGN